MGFKVNIEKSYFAQKVLDGQAAICYVPGCNFKCRFCYVRQNPAIQESRVQERTKEDILASLAEAVALDGAVKITGGEPTLKPELLRFLAESVKGLGGKVILDSNGSNPAQVVALAEAGLIDQLGISLKGISEDEAAHTAGIPNTTVAWKNPIRTIDEIAKRFPGIRVLVTYVVTNSTTDDQIRKVLGRFHDSPGDLFMKFNNVMRPSLVNPASNGSRSPAPPSHVIPTFAEFQARLAKPLPPTPFQGPDFQPIPEQAFQARMGALLQEFPRWIGRTILILNNGGVSSHDHIVKL